MGLANGVPRTVGGELKATAERGAARAQRQRRKHPRDGWQIDLEAVPDQQTAEPFRRLQSLGTNVVADAHGQGNAAGSNLALSDGGEDGLGIGNRHLVVDVAGALLGSVLVHRRLALDGLASHRGVHGKDVQRGEAAAAGAHQRVDDGARLDTRGQFTHAQQHVVLIVDLQDVVASGRGAGTEHGLGEHLSEIVAIRQCDIDTEAGGMAQRRLQHPIGVAGVSLLDVRQLAQPTCVGDAILIRHVRREDDELTQSQAGVGDSAGEITFHVAQHRLRPALGAAIEGELGFVTVEVGHQSHNLGRALDREDPVHELLAP